MRRRDFLRFVGVAGSWPWLVGAQQPPRLIGVLWGGVNPGTSLAESVVSTLIAGLREFGWIEHQNIRIEHRWITAPEKETQPLAKELVDMHPDVIVVNSTPLLAALVHETQTI